MSNPICKHCSKTKFYHEPLTLKCPKPSRSLLVTYEDDKVYDEVVSEPKVLVIPEINQTVSPLLDWKEQITNVDDFVIPLHDKQWVFDTIYKNADVDCEEEADDLKSALNNCDGSIILGKPDTANDGTYLMFGMKTNIGELEDDYCLLDNITLIEWSKLSNLELIEIGTFESHTDIDESKNKGINSFMSEVIGRSLYSPDSVDIKTTADCKSFLKQEYDVEKAKRIKKEKWGQIEYRLFESDEGRHYTLVSYKDKLISHYAFAYNEDY